MAWTNPTTRSTSDLITASIWNTDLVDNLTYLHDLLPTARVYHNTTQSMTASTDNPVLANSERWDTDGIHSTVSNTSRLTCVTAGVYSIYGHIEWTTIPSTATIVIRLNGTTVIAKKNLVSTDKTAFIMTEYKLAAADYVEIIVNPATTQTLTGASNYGTELGMTRIAGG